MDEPSADPGAEPQGHDASHHLCPQCGAAVDGPNGDGPFMTCPECNTQFFIAPPQDAQEAPEESEAQEQIPEEAELSAARIRQMSMLTRTAYRTRSYFIVGALACLGTAAEIISLVIKEVKARHQWSIQAIGGLFLTAAALSAASKFARHALATHREIQAHIRARELEELEIAKREPDLSTLSDGSHHARNLESMTWGGEEGEKERKREGETEV